MSRTIGWPLPQNSALMCIYTVEYSVIGFGIKGRKPTCISGNSADDINAQIPVHDGIKSL